MTRTYWPSILTVALTLTFTVAAQAAVSAEEAARLGKELTPLGVEKAGSPREEGEQDGGRRAVEEATPARALHGEGDERPGSRDGSRASRGQVDGRRRPPDLATTVL